VFTSLPFVLVVLYVLSDFNFKNILNLFFGVKKRYTIPVYQTITLFLLLLTLASGILLYDMA